MDRQLDVLFVSPHTGGNYQALAQQWKAIEVPVWSLLLAQSCRSKGFGCAILDCDAKNLTDERAAALIMLYNPRLVVFVVYGQNPNSGTTNMAGAISLANHLKQVEPHRKVCFVGSHTSALPREVLAEPAVDFVLLNEGVYALHNLLRSDLQIDLQNIKGIGWKRYGAVTFSRCSTIAFELNEPERIVPQSHMDRDLPGYAWDLLPYREKPLDLYRAHLWHADYKHALRTPFAALYTSLGCNFSCRFCMINILNRISNEDNVTAADSATMRFWSTDLIIKEFRKLVDMGVSTIRLSDEMFLLNRKYYEPLCEALVKEGISNHVRMWCYSRVDTVRPQFLDRLRAAGFTWTALGIESANQNVRQEVTKGKFQEVNIREISRRISEAGINQILNYIVGFPSEGTKEILQTCDLACELNSEAMNVYACTLLPGSPLWMEAKRRGDYIPRDYAEYGFLSYEHVPARTKYLTAAEVLQIRDEFWHRYHERPEYQSLVERKFGQVALDNLRQLCDIKLKRRILEN